jgi:uncharacterized protein YdgA (DUF945 family)
VNRWFVALLITLAVIVLVSPGIVGRLAEQSVEENLNFVASEDDEVVVTTESFDRGWFTSEGRHRIELRDGAVGTVFENDADEHDHIPSLIIDTHIDHGLIPVTSMSRDSGSLKPGLASAVSTMTLDPGDGELFEIPGKIYSDVGLTGETALHFLLEAGSRNFDGKTAEWQGADVTVHTNPATGSVSLKGDVLPWSVLDELGSIKFGDMTIDGRQEESPYGLGTGSVQLEMGPVDIENNYSPGTGFNKLSFNASSKVDGDRVNAASKVDISDIRLPAFENIDVAMDLVLNRLDALSFHKIAQALQTTSGSADPESAIEDLYPLIEADLQKLLVAGFEIRIDRFDVTLPIGKVTTKLRFDLPPSSPATAFSWPALLLALDASADIRLPVELFNMVLEMSPEAGALVAMGFLQKDGDFYEMRAEYAKGLLTVNGAPLPIPLPGL